MWASQTEKTEKEAENISEEIMADKFANWMNIYIQETQGTPSMRKSKRPTLRHIITNDHRVIESQRILKAAREKRIPTSKGPSIRLPAHFSLETVQARRQRPIYSKCSKENNKRVNHESYIWQKGPLKVEKSRHSQMDKS